jgi:hypothetical protein
MADCAVLALMASLGLLQLGHETTPELLQLLGVAWWLYALAAAPFRRWRARLSAVAAILVLALSGAAQFAVLLGLGGFLLCQFSRQDGARQARMALALAVVLAIAVATALELWRWRLQAPTLPSTLRLLAWFTWPTAALAAWTVWRWRGYLSHRHVSVPLTLARLDHDPQQRFGARRADQAPAPAPSRSRWTAVCLSFQSAALARQSCRRAGAR